MADTLVVFNDIKDWQAPLISRKKYLTVPKLNLNLKQKLPDDVEKKQKGILEKAYAALFDKAFTAMSNAHFQKIQQIMDTFETALDKLKAAPGVTQQKIEEQVTKINAALKDAVNGWKPKVEKLHDECYEKALAKSDAEMKKKVKRAKIKVILVATLIVLVALTAVALAIVTAGAGTPLIIAIVGGVVTAALAIKKYAGDFKTAWQLCQGKISEIEKEVDASNKVYLELRKLDVKPGAQKSVLDKAQTFKARISLGSANIEKHVGQLEKFANNFSTKLKAYQVELEKLKSEAAKLKQAGKSDAEQQVLIEEQNGLIAKMEGRLKAVADIRAAAAEITAKIKTNGVPDYPKLRKLCDAVGQATDVIKELFSGISKIGTAAQKLKS
jgi:hypothetical protein